ncbi:MFS transporter [Nocardioides sp. zg-1308]|uniref:MFS transporter n=1 Tax=Nocardioides renjunii TaxID=3095075 RepID=A0ABU5KH63_9ACTN|nr:MULTISPECIES: MFS transporter [unclassified Nocardioides]MDZ5663789.1 MFS transporter [Nocardioides sp. S-58]NPD06782.1 MFS transporter [Nocardioides sp. zg-1308]WQQ20870.1 MFS transporter [Nocardioides sp. S-34]
MGEHRRFVTAIVADTVGSGLFMPITLLYFLAMTDLSLVQIGSALSLSAILTMPGAFVIGTLVDRFGPRLMMLGGNLVQAAGMVAYLWTDSLLAVALWTALLNVGRQAFWGSFGNVVTAISAPGEREVWFGFLQAVRNLGYSVGGVLAGIALQVGTDVAFQAVVVINAVTFVVAFVLLLDVPDHRVAHADDAPVEGWGVVLRDRAYLRLVVAQLGFVTGMMVLNFALPVYAAETIDLPGWVVGAIFTLNTALVGLGQGLVVRGMTGQVRARMMGLAQLVFVASYAMFVVAGWLPVWLAVVVMLAGSAVYTFGELTGGPVFSATAAEAAPDHLRGRYLGLFQLSWGLGGAVTPVAFTWLLAHGDTTLWWVLGLVALVSAAYLQTLPRVLPAAGARVTQRAPEPDAA